MLKSSQTFSKGLLTVATSALALAFATSSLAAEIPYVPSAAPPAAPSFPLSEMNDGITADTTPGFNGYVARVTSGSITMTLPGRFNLTGMKLWNDVNVRREGVKNFTLRFYRGSTPAGTFSASAPDEGQIEEQDYILNATDVDKVIMDITARDGFGIEVRELKLFGLPVAKSTDFTCYDLMDHERDLYRKRVEVVDQFGSSRSVIGHPVSICNPAGINDRKFNPKKEKDHLVCYEIIDEKTERRTEHRVKTTNPLETNVLVTGGIDELCVVSTKEHIRARPGNEGKNNRRIR